MIRAFSYANPLDAHDDMCDRLVFGDNSREMDWDWTHGTEVGLHNVAIHCKSIDFDYNLKRLWVPPTRWTMMVRQYIDPTALDHTLAMIEDRMTGPTYGRRKGRGIAVMRMGEHDVDMDDYDMISLDADAWPETLATRMVMGKGTGRGVRRRWGSCMLSMSYRQAPVPTISLHSRTTYFGYLALVDMAVARAFAAECAAVTGIPLAEHEFVWTLDLAQFHGFRSLAWMLMDDERRSEMDNDVDRRTEFKATRIVGNMPGYRKALDGYARILKSDRAGTLYGDESFSSFARVRRRFHVEAFGVEYANRFAGGTRNRGGKGAFPPLPDLWVRDLDMTSLPDGTPDDDGDDDDD
jgi:hypothetical protein